MGLEDADLVDDGDAGGGGKDDFSISCSICLEFVTDIGDRGVAKLQCGHEFHLDCIGSAFNVKGVMQCPNCRKVEKGQWLYANGCRPYPELNMDDWTHDEDLYDLSYSETSMWCPFGGFTRLAASFDDGEFPTAPYHDLVGQHAIFSEHAGVSSATHLCPYVAYVQPLHPSSSSSTSSASIADGQWNRQSASSTEIPHSYPLPTIDVRYHNNLFPPSNNRLGGADQPSVMPRRPGRINADVARSGSYVHPFLVGQSSAAIAPNSVGSSTIHSYPGSAARARERNQALQAYFHQTSNLPVSRRSNPHPQMGQPGSSSDQIHLGGMYYLPTPTPGNPSTPRTTFQDAESSMPNPFHHIWERDPPPHPGPGWGFHQGGGAVFRQRHGSERTQSQGHHHHNHRS